MVLGVFDESSPDTLTAVLGGNADIAEVKCAVQILIIYFHELFRGEFVHMIDVTSGHDLITAAERDDTRHILVDIDFFDEFAVLLLGLGALVGLDCPRSPTRGPREERGSPNASRLDQKGAARGGASVGAVVDDQKLHTTKVRPNKWMIDKPFLA